MPDPQPTGPISLGDALRYWLKLGCISFGGPAGQIAIMHQELVEKRRWISEERFLHALNYCMLLPGPEAQQLATYIGWLMHGVKGGILAGALFVLPSLLILIGLSWLYVTFGQTPIVSGLLYGIKPTVTAIVAFAAWRIGNRVLKNGFLWTLTILAFAAIFFFKISFPWIILGAALIGAIAGNLLPDWFKEDRHAKSHESYGPAVIDDLTPLPEHARFSPRRIVLIALIGFAVWAGMLALLGGWESVRGTLAQMSWFFTQAALLTFGGAYAVLPYVYQGAVEQYQWLTAHAMIDGLALGETTPGPLIMIVAFVGFLGGVTKEIFGAGNVFAAGAAGACVATFFTFLPSFLFILVGGPLVEATRNNLKFTAPLNAITAAVVGVIVNLALFFAWHVLWPQASEAAPFNGQFEWFALPIGGVAGIALIHYKVNVVTVIAAGGLVGLAYQLLIK